MEIKILNRNFDLTDPFRAYLHEKFDELEKYYDNIISFKVELMRDQHHKKGEVFTVEAHLNLANQKPLVVKETHHDARAAVDIVQEKLIRQINKAKSKHHSKLRRGQRLIKSLKFWGRKQE